MTRARGIRIADELARAIAREAEGAVSHGRP